MVHADIQSEAGVLKLAVHTGRENIPVAHENEDSTLRYGCHILVYKKSRVFVWP